MSVSNVKLLQHKWTLLPTRLPPVTQLRSYRVKPKRSYEFALVRLKRRLQILYPKILDL
jgi:hypothetical protein